MRRCRRRAGRRAVRRRRLRLVVERVGASRRRCSSVTCWANGSFDLEEREGRELARATRTALARKRHAGHDCNRCRLRRRRRARRRRSFLRTRCRWRRRRRRGVAAGAASGWTALFISFGTWIAATASSRTPPTMRMVFCFFALAAASVTLSGHQGVAPAATVPLEDVSVVVDGSGVVAGAGALKE